MASEAAMRGAAARGGGQPANPLWTFACALPLTIMPLSIRLDCRPLPQPFSGRLRNGRPSKAKSRLSRDPERRDGTTLVVRPQPNHSMLYRAYPPAPSDASAPELGSEFETFWLPAPTLPARYQPLPPLLLSVIAFIEFRNAV